MYTNVWARYLPIIRIVLKRSLTAEQLLTLNASDFLNAGLSRKSGYKFLLRFRDGRIDNVIVDLPLASSLASVLKNDEKIREIFADNEFHISLNPKFELSIKHIQHLVRVEELVEAETI